MGEPSVAYKCYVLMILLFMCISNLATRNLPSYLITVPVPICEEVCAGVVDRPLCGSHKWNYYPSDREPTPFEACQLCRARLVWVDRASSGQFETPHTSTPEALRRTVRLRHGNADQLASFLIGGLEHRMQAMDDFANDDNATAADKLIKPQMFHETAHRHDGVAEEDGMANESLSEHIARAADAVMHHHGTVVVKDASFYNMADGACLTHSEYGLLSGYGFALIFAIASLPAGRICDRKPRVATASTALLAWSMATAMQASAHSFSFLLLCRCVIGLSQAFAMPAAISLASDYFREKQTLAELVLCVGLYMGSGCASFSILLAEALGWRWAVLLSGLGGLIVTILLYATVREPERTEWSAPCALDVVAHEVYEKSRVARMLIMAASAKMIAAYSLSAFLPIWYARVNLIGFSTNEYAVWNAFTISIGGMLSALCGTFLNHHLGKVDYRAPCWIGLFGSLMSIPLICVMLFTSYFVVSMSAFFLLIIVGESWFAPAMALLQASVRRSVRAQAVTASLVGATLVGNLGPTVLGFIDPGGESIGFHLAWICILANLAAALSFVWTAHEINLDPVAAGVGDKFDAFRMTFDTIGADALPIPPRGTSLPWGFF